MATNLAYKAEMPSDVQASVITSFEKADHQKHPYDFWLLDNVFPTEIVRQIARLPFDAPKEAVFDGRRESNNSQRIYFTPENQDRFPVCREVVKTFSDPATLQMIKKMTGADVAKGHLRVEYCQDTDGFWLEPHLDISVKLFTMLVYVSDDPNLSDAGTDVYDDTPEHKLVASAPYAFNKGMVFIPGSNTWHGFAKRSIKGLRKSIIINYVSPEWRATGELSYR